MTAASKQQSRPNLTCPTGDVEGECADKIDLRHTGTLPDAGKYSDRPMEGLWQRFVRLLYGSFIEPLVRSRNTPNRDALGVSLGLIVGFIVPVGGQLLMLTLLRLVFRFNYLAAVGFSLVSNPFDAIPMYYGYYHLGSYLLGKPAAIDFSVFRNLMNSVMDKAYFWEGICAFTALSGEILERWLTSAIFLSVIFGSLGYAITLRIQKSRCRKAARRMGMEYEAFLQHLEREARGKNDTTSQE